MELVPAWMSQKERPVDPELECIDETGAVILIHKRNTERERTAPEWNLEKQLGWV